MRTGCRDSELDKLRRDAATENEAGYIRWLPAAQVAESNDGVIGHLFLNRSKSGIEPWAEICVEFEALLKCFFAWHDAKHGTGAGSLPFFAGVAAAGRGQKSFGAKLGAACKRLGLPHVTPHGMRSYFATKHWRDKKRPEEIARLMGDQSVALVQSTYADMEKGAKLERRCRRNGRLNGVGGICERKMRKRPANQCAICSRLTPTSGTAGKFLN